MQQRHVAGSKHDERFTANSPNSARNTVLQSSIRPASKAMLASKETAGSPETRSQDSLKLISSQAILVPSISWHENPRPSGGKLLGCSASESAVAAEAEAKSSPRSSVAQGQAFAFLAEKEDHATLSALGGNGKHGAEGLCNT